MTGISRPLRNSAGFSLMELMLATGIIVVIFAGGAGVVSQMYSSVFKEQVRPYQLNQQNFDMQQEMVQSGYVNKMMKDVTNSESLSCLSKGDCKKRSGKWMNLVLKRYSTGLSNFAILTNSPKDVEEGLDLGFHICKISAPDCLTRIVAQWTPLCGSDSECKQPQVQIYRRVYKRQDRGWKEMPELGQSNVLELDVAEGKGICDLRSCVSSVALKKACGDRSPSGYAADGSPICLEVARLVPCSENQKLSKLDSDGQPVCVSAPPPKKD